MSEPTKNAPKPPLAGADGSAALAGLSVHTTLRLKYAEDGDIVVGAQVDPGTGLYGGVIAINPGYLLVRARCTFASESDAETHMRSVIAAARAWEPSPNAQRSATGREEAS